MPRNALAREVASQLEEFRRLLGRDPTHLDSHYHVHLHSPARDLLFALAAQLRIPLRFFDARVRHCGLFGGLSKEGEPRPETIRVNALLAVLETLPPGSTELVCHPGDGTDPVDDYGAELRALELETLCDPHLRDALRERGVRLASFASYRRAKPSP